MFYYYVLQHLTIPLAWIVIPNMTLNTTSCLPSLEWDIQTPTTHPGRPDWEMTPGVSLEEKDISGLDQPL